MPFDLKGARAAGYSDDEILQHLLQRRKFDVQGAVKEGYSKQEIVDHLAAVEPSSKSLTEQALDVPKGVVNILNPIEMVKGLGQALSSPIQTGSALLAGQGKLGQEAIDAFKQGEYVKAARKGIHYLLPMVGQQLDASAEEAVAGNVGQAIGEGIGAGIDLAGPSKLANVPGVKLLPKMAANNPVVRAAVDFADKRGIPVSAAVRSDNSFVRSGQKLVDTTPIGAYVANKAKVAADESLQRVGRELAAEVHPKPVVPETAATAVRNTVDKRVTALNDTARQNYGTFHSIEADPRNLQSVQVGTKQVPSGVVDASGNEIVHDVPITREIAMPVDVRPLKAELQPIYQEMQKWWEPAKRNASPGYTAIKSIIEGDDVVPASVAEKGLGGLKELSREAPHEAMRDVSQGLAAKIIPELQDAIDNAVASSPQEPGLALQSLRNGRAVTAEKHGVFDVLKQFREEPVQFFQQMVYSKDSGVDLLRDIAKQAPKEMPKVGRAYLEDLLQKATAEGGFDKAQGVLTQWQNLGGETKKLLFKNPMLVKDLDNFFLVAKKMAENPNPSGSALTWSVGSQLGGFLATDPVTAASWVIGTGAIAKILHSPKGSKLLRDGLKIPLGNKAAAAANTAAILKMAGNDARRVEAEAGASLRPALAY